MIDYGSLIKAGVHFGHQTSRWCPLMKRFIWGYKNGVHLIDVSKTAQQLEKAAAFLQEVAADGKSILWVGTKKPAQAVIMQTAQELGMPHVSHRWIGGSLSNFMQVKKSITKLLHYEDIIKKADRSFYTKKELNTFQKIVDRLRKNVGGIINLKWPLGAVIVVDVRKEGSAIREAATMGIPVVALVDTNGDPSLVDYVIPANDDAPRSIKVLIDYLAESVKKGQALRQAQDEREEAEKKEEEKQAKAEKEKPADKKVEAKSVVAKAKPASSPDEVADKHVKKAAPKKTTTKKAAEPKAKTTEKKPAAKKTTAAKETTKKGAPKKTATKPATKKTTTTATKKKTPTADKK